MSSNLSNQVAPLRRKRLADADRPDHAQPKPTTSDHINRAKSSKPRAIVHFFSCGIQEKNFPDHPTGLAYHRSTALTNQEIAPCS